MKNKARAGSAEGRKNARKEAQDGAASPTLEGIRRFMRLAFCPLVVRRSAALPCGKAAASLFPRRRARAGRRAARLARGRTAFAADSAAKAVQFRPTGTRSCAVGFDSADSSAFFRRRS
ncbi:MAG: hypothetical protein ACI3ZE_02605, partial [Candidatus Woodwardiibium sp.]